MKCNVLPPRQLYHPTLPYKCNSKLIFSLCSASDNTTNKCSCTPRQLLSTHRKVYELLTSPGTAVTNLIFRNNKVAWVSWKCSEDNVVTGKNVNVAVAAYVTTQARLNCTNIWVSWESPSCTAMQTRLSTFKMWMSHQNLKQGITGRPHRWVGGVWLWPLHWTVCIRWP
jgi:hypothetical protein